MKKEFIGFYDPTEDEVNNAWSNGNFVFDTNALLNLYRYTDATRKDFLLALKRLKDRLFLPYQVGHEFHTNRHIVIENLNNSYSYLIKIINEYFDKTLKAQIAQFQRHPSINVNNIYKLQEEFSKKVSDELDSQKKTHPDFSKNDEVLTQLTEYYEGKVGKEFTRDELKKIYQEGKERYEQLIPPGYKDQETKSKRGERHIYGDYIIWKEIIAHTKKEKKPIVFVTDDRKDDWWTIENGKTIRPKEELIKEFYELTGVRILIYNADSFLQFAKLRNLVSEIKESSIVEVKEIRKTDERNKLASDGLSVSSKEAGLLTERPVFYNPGLNPTGSVFNGLRNPGLFGVVNQYPFLRESSDGRGVYAFVPTPTAAHLDISELYAKPISYIVGSDNWVRQNLSVVNPISDYANSMSFKTSNDEFITASNISSIKAPNETTLTKDTNLEPENQISEASK